MREAAYFTRRDGVKSERIERVLVHLRHDGATTLLYLSRPTRKTRWLLRRWAREIVRHPSLLRAAGDA